MDGFTSERPGGIVCNAARRAAGATDQHEAGTASRGRRPHPEAAREELQDARSERRLEDAREDAGASPHPADVEAARPHLIQPVSPAP